MAEGGGAPEAEVIAKVEADPEVAKRGGGTGAARVVRRKSTGDTRAR